MSVMFTINEESAIPKLQGLMAKIDELSNLETACASAKEELATYTQCLSLEQPAIGLMTDCSQAIHTILPIMKDAVGPINAYVKNMLAVNEEVKNMTAAGLDVE